MPPVRVDTDTTATVHLTGDTSLSCCVVIYEKNDDWFKAGIRLCPEHFPEAWEQQLAYVWAAQYSGADDEGTGSPGCIEKMILYPGATWQDWCGEFNPQTWATFLEDRLALIDHPDWERFGQQDEPPEENPNISRLWFKFNDEECSALLDFDPTRRKDRRWWISIEGKMRYQG